MVQLVDVLPLVAEELGLELSPEVEGVPPGQREVALAELYREASTVMRFGTRYDHDLRVAIEWPHKLERREDGRERMLRISDELTESPEPGSQDARDRLGAALDAHSAGPRAAAVPPEMDPDVVDALRELGYME